MGAPSSTSSASTAWATVIGEIRWVADWTRLEVALASSKLGGFLQAPEPEHLEAAYRIIGYLVATKSLGITYGGTLKVPMGLDSMPEYFIESNGLYAAADSSWNILPLPQGGFVVMYMNGAIMWCSKKSKIVAMSTCEAETDWASKAAKAVIFVRMVLEFLRRPVVGPTLLLEDNKATFDTVTKEGVTARTRYYERETIFIKWAIIKLIVQMNLVSTDMMMADIFTKAVDLETHTKMRNVMMNISWTHKGNTAKLTRLVLALNKTLSRMA